MQILRSFHTIAPTITVRRSTESVTMATMKFSARRLIIAGGFAVAVAAAPAIAFVATPAPSAGSLACAGGEEPDLYTSDSFPHLVPTAGRITPPGPQCRPAVFRNRRQPRPARGEPAGRRRVHSLHRPQLRTVHRP